MWVWLFGGVCECYARQTCGGYFGLYFRDIDCWSRDDLWHYLDVWARCAASCQ